MRSLVLLAVLAALVPAALALGDDERAEREARADAESEAAAETLRPAVRITRDIRYHAEEGADAARLSLDVYAPSAALADGSAGRPVMLFVHGGGWKIGDKRGVNEKPRFFNEAGWVLVSTNYRFVPDGAHPTNVRDVARAIAWTRQNIVEHGGDPDSIFVMGHSAGAHLAALVATDASHLESVGETLRALRGVVLLDGAGYDLTWRMRNLGVVAAGMYREAFGENNEALWRAASPVTYVATDKGIPPFLITWVASRADSGAMSRRLAAKLRIAGVRADVLAADGKTHATINREFGADGDLVTLSALAFLTSVWETPRAIPVEANAGADAPSDIPSPPSPPAPPSRD